MDSLKKPEMILSLGNTMAIIGSTIYFYQQISSLNVEVEKLTEMLKTSVKKLTALQDKMLTPDQVKEALVPFGQKVDQVHKASEMVSESCLRDFEYLEKTLESVVNSLKEQGVEISLPRKKKNGKRGKRGKKSSKKTKPSRHRKREYSDSSESESSDSESSDEEDVASYVANIRKSRHKHR